MYFRQLIWGAAGAQNSDRHVRKRWILPQGFENFQAVVLGYIQLWLLPFMADQFFTDPSVARAVGDT